MRDCFATKRYSSWTNASYGASKGDTHRHTDTHTSEALLMTQATMYSITQTHTYPVSVSFKSQLEKERGEGGGGRGGERGRGEREREGERGRERGRGRRGQYTETHSCKLTRHFDVARVW